LSQSVDRYNAQRHQFDALTKHGAVVPQEEIDAQQQKLDAAGKEVDQLLSTAINSLPADVKKTAYVDAAAKYIEKAYTDNRVQQARHQAMNLLANTYEIYDFTQPNTIKPPFLPPAPDSDVPPPPTGPRTGGGGGGGGGGRRGHPDPYHRPYKPSRPPREETIYKPKPPVY
jgi:hypothetical protein